MCVWLGLWVLEAYGCVCVFVGGWVGRYVCIQVDGWVAGWLCGSICVLMGDKEEEDSKKIC